MTDRLTNQLTQKELILLSKGKLRSMPFDTTNNLAFDLIAVLQREAKLREALEHLADYKGILGDSYVRTYCLEKLAQYRAATGKSEGE